MKLHDLLNKYNNDYIPNEEVEETNCDWNKIRHYRFNQFIEDMRNAKCICAKKCCTCCCDCCCDCCDDIENHDYCGCLDRCVCTNNSFCDKIFECIDLKCYKICGCCCC